MYKKTIRTTALYQYLCIYLSIQYIGGRFAEFLGSDFFGILSLSISLFYLIHHFPAFLHEKHFILFLFGLSVSMSATILVTMGGLSVFTALSIISRFLITYTSINIDKKNFTTRFLKLCFLFSCISLILFIYVQISGPELAKTLFFSHLYEIKNAKEWMPSSYGLFFICYNFMNSARNSYMFGEPGQYQMLIMLALYFLTFSKHNIQGKQKIRYFVIFIATMLTIQSTTGFFNLAVFLVCVLCSDIMIISLPIKRRILVFIIGIIIYATFFMSETNIIYIRIISKIMDVSTGKLNFAIETGADRIKSILDLFHILYTQPLLLVFGVGYRGIVSLRGGFSCSGIINTIIMLGFFTCIILYGYIIKGYIKFAPDIYALTFLLFMLFSNGFSQPNLLSITSVIICCYNWLLKSKPYDLLADERQIIYEKSNALL